MYSTVTIGPLQETLGLGVSYRSRGRRGMGGGRVSGGGGGLMGAQGWGILNIPSVSSPYVYPPPTGPPFLQYVGTGDGKIGGCVLQGEITYPHSVEYSGVVYV